MDIYKEHVIEALEEEPLAWGSWADIDVIGLFPEPANTYEECKVCSVGGVFRRFTDKNTFTIGWETNRMLLGDASPYSDCDKYTELPGNWITAISYVWESMQPCYGSTTDGDVEEARVHMLDWVEDNVPEDEVLWTIS